MENKSKEEAIDMFLDINEEETESKKVKIIEEREGLIERFEHKFVTSDGRELLREQY